MHLSPFFLLLASARLPISRAWGAAGHEIVATIAQSHLHPTVLPTVCDILNFTSTNPDKPQCHLAPIAAWADRIRYRMPWSGPLHYIGGVGDHPPDHCKFPGSRGWEGHSMLNVLGAVRNTTGLLEQYVHGESSITTANEALKFLVHFVGDMHMPLHLTGRDRGGNSDKVKFGGRTTNLHAVWDNFLVAKAIRETPRNYSAPLPSHQIEFALRGTIYDPYVRRIMWEGILSQWSSDLSGWLACPTLVASPSIWQKVLSAFTFDPSDTDDNTLCPYHWAQPIHALNCELVWPPELDEPPYNGGLSGISSDSAAFAGVGLDEDRDYDCDDSTEEDCMLRGPPHPLLQLDTPKYAGVIKDDLVVEKLLAQAGIRLAAVLNWLFADDGDDFAGARKLRTPKVAIDM
ncbi:hypothetical protein C0989_010897 [Termitomyces sp. Mn162]|nr:hypothetical protein C0989_010897 [Termitomyces sp. Mn162]